jgi:hypothetical protein
MTREEAEAFIKRNPKHTIESFIRLRAIAEEFQLEKFYDFGAASNEEDSLVNLLEVAEALKDINALDKS